MAGDYSPTTQEIKAWFEANPNATDKDIASAMQQYGVSAGAVAAATNTDLNQVIKRYEAATGGAPIPEWNPPPSTPKVSVQDVTQWFNDNPGASDKDIAQAMNQYKVGPGLISQATGVSVDEVKQRYSDALGLPNIGAASKPMPIDPGRARAMIEQSMVSGVPTAEFEKYGGYDKVYQMAQQAGLGGGYMSTGQTASHTQPQPIATQPQPSSIQPPAISEYQAVTREVNPETDTVQGQLDSILDEDSPLMRRAKSLALADMASRGLLNSSLATTAGYAAMIDKALPIAQQDAETYFKQGLTNQDYRNQADLTNANWRNKLLENSYVTQLDFWKQSNLMAQQYGYDVDLLNKTNEWQSKLLATEYDFKQKLQQDTIDADLQANYIATYTDMLNQLDAILADPNIDDKSKEVMVNKYVEAVRKMSDSLETVGAPIPEFDFSQYYVEPDSSAVSYEEATSNSAVGVYSNDSTAWENLSAEDQWKAYLDFMEGKGAPTPIPTKSRPTLWSYGDD